MDEPTLYRIIANCEDEYAVWPLDARVPSAWRGVGVTGTREECAGYIRRVDTAAGPIVRRIVERELIRP